MPYACAASANGVHVTPSNAITYRILGERIEQPLSDCTSEGRCRTLMVHSFALECGGKSIPWAAIAKAAARDAGVPLPEKLPAGFAPVSTMSGRFVLPAIAPVGTAPAGVSRQRLSPDSVIQRADEDERSSPGGWQTEVRADAISPSPDGKAMRVAASLVAMMALLFAASLVAAGRLRFPALAAQGTDAGRFAFAARLFERASETVAGLRDRVARWQEWTEPGDSRMSEELLNAMSTLQARLLHVELKIAALEPGLLLRDVLAREISGIRARMADLESAVRRAPSSKAAVTIRILLRDLERINRIAESAGRDSGVGEVRSEADAMPESEAEAYRVLGINPEAAPAVAKKLVDALRMSWHPDYARDEEDRQRRECRMKQINAAWDLVKSNHRAAA